LPCPWQSQIDVLDSAPRLELLLRWREVVQRRPELAARQPHRLVTRVQQPVQLLLQSKAGQQLSHVVMDEQRQQPAVITKDHCKTCVSQAHPASARPEGHSHGDSVLTGVQE
jgi:hypothetical protein